MLYNLDELKNISCLSKIERFKLDVIRDAQIIAEAISVIVSNSKITTENRMSNHITGIQIKDSDIVILKAEEEKKKLYLYEDNTGFDDDIETDAQDIKLVLQYNEKLYYVLIRGIYFDVGIETKINGQYDYSKSNWNICKRMTEYAISVYGSSHFYFETGIEKPDYFISFMVDKSFDKAMYENILNIRLNEIKDITKFEEGKFVETEYMRSIHKNIMPYNYYSNNICK